MQGRPELWEFLSLKLPCSAVLEPWLAQPAVQAERPDKLAEPLGPSESLYIPGQRRIATALYDAPSVIRRSCCAESACASVLQGALAGDVTAPQCPVVACLIRCPL